MTISYQLVEVVIFLLGILASVREVDSTTVSPNVDSTTEEILEAEANGIGTVDISTEATVTFRTDMITTEGTEENLVTEESEQSSDEVVTVYHTTADEPVDVAKAQRMGLWDTANDQHPEAEPSPEPTSNVSTATSVIETAPLDSEAEPGQEILATETAVLGDLNGRISNGTANSLPPVAVHLVLQYGGKNASSSHQQYAASSLATGSRQSSVTTAGALSKSCDLDCINGDCILQEYKATCQCHDGYEHNHDQTSCSDISECKSTTTNDCSQFAKCIELDGSFNCSCAEGYDDLSPDRGRPGRVCEVASSDICPSTYCLNGGTCHGDSIANQTCRCRQGLSGERCEIVSESQVDDLTGRRGYRVLAFVLAIVIGGMLTVAALVYLVFWCRIRRRSGRYFRKKKRSSDSWDSSYESSFTTGSGLFASSVDAHSDQRSESSSQRSRNSPVISVGMRARLNDDFVKELQAQISSLSGSAHSNDSVENEVVIRPKKWVAEEARGRTPLKCKQYFGRFSGPRPRSREQRRLKDKGEESARELSIHSKDSSTCGRWI